jgi:hypothetical protein
MAPTAGIIGSSQNSYMKVYTECGSNRGGALQVEVKLHRL